MLDPVSNKIDFSAQEEAILDFWKREDIFRRSIDERDPERSFVFYDGPPFATGLPHYGHILAGTIKDVVPRYQTMRGHRVERRFGWDCHGLPIENEIEKSLGISGRRKIEEFGVDKFNEACRGTVLKYAKDWERIVWRTGRWVDFEHDYKTMDLSFMESIWWVFKQCWEKGLIYEGKKCMPFCPRCSTPLSNFEVQLAYKEVKDPAVIVRFQDAEDDALSYLAWTTTPWTLPSNLALTVGADIDYVFVRRGDEVLVVAEALVESVFRGEEDLEIQRRVKGSDLAGRSYRPLFPYFADLEAEGAFRVVTADFVTTEDGTGIVHTAPGFGEDDFAVGEANGLPLVCPMDMEGRFTEEVADFAGMPVKEADQPILDRLKAEGRVFRKDQYVHNYPHCWRCDSPLFYRAITTWFLEVKRIKDAMLAANAKTRWVPAHIRDGRFGKWLEGARDWAISRNRFWGTPLPVWKCAEGHATCLGSVAELEAASGAQVTDIHKHFVDDLEIPCGEEGCDLPARRIEEVLDCWFESGSMPYAQVHYPFENKDRFEKTFPADFIAEGLDQTRGWFYSLTVLGTALFNTSPFKNVIVNGLVLAEDGKKMSKRLKNYPEPLQVIHDFSADAMRLALMHSPVVRAEDLKFSAAAVEHELRSLLIPLWNAYAFFVSYARTDGFDPTTMLHEGPFENALDRWILSRLQGLERTVIDGMDAYDLQVSVNAFVDFIDDLTNWYIRRSRRRFWKSENDADKVQAHSTLYTVLLELSQVVAPYVPFISEAIWRNLRTDAMADSVHLSLFPEPDEKLADPALETQMDRVIRAASMGRALRVKHEIKIRQPLQAITLVTRDRAERALLEELAHLLEEELNVKEVRFTENEDDLVEISAKGNFRELGKRFGKATPKVAAAIAKLEAPLIRRLEAGETLTLDAGEVQAEVTLSDLVLQRSEREGLLIENDGTLTVGLVTEITPELEAEGLAREFVSKVQNMRKQMGLEITDRIRVRYQVEDEKLAQALAAHGDYVKREVLARELVRADAPQGEPHDLNGIPVTITLEKA